MAPAIGRCGDVEESGDRGGAATSEVVRRCDKGGGETQRADRGVEMMPMERIPASV